MKSVGLVPSNKYSAIWTATSPSSKLKFPISLSPTVSVRLPFETWSFIAFIKPVAAVKTSPGFASALKVAVMFSSSITTSATSIFPTSSVR